MYQIRSAADGRALAGGGVLSLVPFTGTSGQLWKIDGRADGSYRIAFAADHQALTATVKTKPGNGVGLATFQGDDTQRWVIAPP